MDLTSERNRLNLLEVTHDPINLQEILDREAHSFRKKADRFQREAPDIPIRPQEPEEPTFLLEGGISLDDSIPMELNLEPKGPSVPPPKESGEIEISLEGLDLSFFPPKDIK
jgi:hypothetical protein